MSMIKSIQDKMTRNLRLANHLIELDSGGVMSDEESELIYGWGDGPIPDGICDRLLGRCSLAKFLATDPDKEEERIDRDYHRMIGIETKIKKGVE